VVANIKFVKIWANIEGECIATETQLEIDDVWGGWRFGVRSDSDRTITGTVG